MRAAHTNEPIEDIGSYEMKNLPDEILAGLFICSHDPDVIEEATIWNVRIDRPVVIIMILERKGTSAAVLRQ